MAPTTLGFALTTLLLLADTVQARMEVEDLFTDLADGKKLLKLLEIISGEKLAKPNNGRMRVHKIENVNKSLAFLHTKVSPPWPTEAFLSFSCRRVYLVFLLPSVDARRSAWRASAPRISSTATRVSSSVSSGPSFCASRSKRSKSKWYVPPPPPKKK